MRLKQYIEDHKLTHAEFAERIGGVTGEAVRLWAAGRRMPGVTIVQRIQEVTGNQVTLEDLFNAKLEATGND